MAIEKSAFLLRANHILRHSRCEAHTAGILLEFRIIETLLQGKRARPGLVLRAILIGKNGRFLLARLGLLGQFCILCERNLTHYIGDRPKV